MPVISLICKPAGTKKPQGQLAMRLLAKQDAA